MSSSQTAGAVAAETVEAVLKKASTGKDRPTDADLGPCYSFLIDPTGSAESSSGQKCAHWYCDKSPSELHTRVATYLFFLFAFRREGTSKIWVETLENVVSNCEACARGFGIARRTFGRR
jgi:senataxin